MQILEAKLTDLKIDPSNVRQTDKAPDEGLLASIRSKGLLVPLIVRKNGGAGYYVIEGGRRLAALHILSRDGDFDKATTIPCILRDNDAAAAADISLTANFIRENMHPVDEYEAFAKLVDGGKTPEAIRDDYGIPLKLVVQTLALGRLAPEVRAAWRESKLDDAAAKAFTLEPDQKAQAELLARLRKRHGLNAWTVKSAIIGDEREAKAMIDFVGLDAYKAAGGSTTQDLFADAKDAVAVATDMTLLKKLYDQKLKEKVAELKAEGWKWVEFQSDLGYSASWWPSKPKKDVKEADRAKLGVIINKGHHSDIEIKYGVQKPAEEKREAKKKAAAKNGVAVVALPAALCGRLTDQMTEATAEVVKSDATLALAIVAAALTSIDSPIHIRGDGKSAAKFAVQLPLMRKKSAAELHKVLADIASESVTIGASSQESLPLSKNRPNDRALLEGLDPKKLNAQLRASFDAADYFAGVTALACKDAIVLCDPKQPITGKEKKSELAKLAVDLVKKSNAGGKAGYLPPEMRTAHYDGPAPKVAAKAKPTKKKAR